MEKTSKRNYFIQSNFFTQSVLSDASELQKDIIYYLLTQIDFYDANPSDDIRFDYEKFIEYKKIETKKNLYSPVKFKPIINGLMRINGMFFNKKSKQLVYFNLIDNVVVDLVNPNRYTVKLAYYGKIFFFEKHALEYVNNSQVLYTQIEKNIIDLKGDKRKKFFEILSQFKESGLFRTTLEELKIKLGFIEYNIESSRITPSAKEKKHKEIQLQLLFDDKISPYPEFERIEYLSSWYEFKRVFLEPAIEEYNNNSKLDIYNIIYSVRKTGRKITGLEFTFKKRMKLTELTAKEQSALAYFKDYGLSEIQILFLLQRLGYEEMHRRFNGALTFNHHFDTPGHEYYHRKIYFENENKKMVMNLGGYLYEKVFPELKSNSAIK